jgi:hypothetical protein
VAWRDARGHAREGGDGLVEAGEVGRPRSIKADRVTQQVGLGGELVDERSKRAVASRRVDEQRIEGRRHGGQQRSIDGVGDEGGREGAQGLHDFEDEGEEARAALLERRRRRKQLCARERHRWHLGRRRMHLREEARKAVRELAERMVGVEAQIGEVVQLVWRVHDDVCKPQRRLLREAQAQPRRRAVDRVGRRERQVGLKVGGEYHCGRRRGHLRFATRRRAVHLVHVAAATVA